MTTPANPFGLHPMDLTAAFIDGPNLFMTTKQLDSENNIDFAKLRKLFTENTRVQDMAYYTSLREVADGQDDHTPLIPLMDYLANNGYRVEEKVARMVTTELGSKFKASVNMEIAVDAIQAAEMGMMHIVLFISDGDMAPLIPAIKRKGARVTIVSTKRKKVVSQELCRLADEFVELEDVLPLITRPAGRGHARRPKETHAA